MGLQILQAISSPLFQKSHFLIKIYNLTRSLVDSCVESWRNIASWHFNSIYIFIIHIQFLYLYVLNRQDTLSLFQMISIHLYLPTNIYFSFMFILSVFLTFHPRSFRFCLQHVYIFRVAFHSFCFKIYFLVI